MIELELVATGASVTPALAVVAKLKANAAARTIFRIIDRSFFIAPLPIHQISGAKLASEEAKATEAKPVSRGFIFFD